MFYAFRCKKFYERKVEKRKSCFSSFFCTTSMRTCESYYFIQTICVLLLNRNRMINSLSCYWLSLPLILVRGEARSETGKRSCVLSWASSIATILIYLSQGYIRPRVSAQYPPVLYHEITGISFSRRSIPVSWIFVSCFYDYRTWLSSVASSVNVDDRLSHPFSGIPF